MPSKVTQVVVDDVSLLSFAFLFGLDGQRDPGFDRWHCIVGTEVLTSVLAP